VSAEVSAADPPTGMDARSGFVHELEDLERHPEEESLDVPAGEFVPDHVDGTELTPPHPDLALRMVGEHLVQRGAEPHRGELRTAEDRLDLVVLV
jgi:hypothetical protein